MNRKTKSIATGGMLSALSLVLLLIASVMPGGRLILTALAGIVGAVTVVRAGMATGVLSWVAVSILALFIIPSKGCVILYAVFFGPYTILKNLIEKLDKKPLEWVLKYLFCLAVSSLLFIFSADVLGLFPAILADHLWAFLPAIAVAFLAYDILFSKLIYYIITRLPQG